LLLLGTVLLSIGAVFHPVLAGDAATQLRTIASTPHWRTLHLVMLAGSGFVAAGIWVRLVIDRGRATSALAAALALIGIGAVLNALNIAYMAGAGTHLASLFATGFTDASRMFEATHPIGLMSARFGNFVVALGALVLGMVEWEEVTRPRWLALLAWAAALAGFAGVVFFEESSRAALAAVAVLSGWQVATAVRALRDVRT
jgi:hypothetical protein